MVSYVSWKPVSPSSFSSSSSEEGKRAERETGGALEVWKRVLEFIFYIVDETLLKEEKLMSYGTLYELLVFPLPSIDSHCAFLVNASSSTKKIKESTVKQLHRCTDEKPIDFVCKFRTQFALCIK